MNTYIALMRHGVTDWNYDGRAQGHTDIPLNREGEWQAEAAAARLAGEHWDVIYSSDLARARATALAVCRRTGHELITDLRLRERQIGPAEGLTPIERNAIWPGLSLGEIPGVESNDQLAVRGEAVITEIARRHPGRRVLVVAHGGLISYFLQRAVGAPHAISRNTGITPVVYDGRSFALAGEHDYRHLLVDGVEYSGEKLRLAGYARERGLPGLEMDPEQARDLLLHSSAVESAWVEDRLVGYARAFTDRVRYGYIDLLYTAPGYQRVGRELRRRLAERFPAVRFGSRGAQEATGA
ncbi:putative phosphoglycerate mutase [Symbiobacterium terraclitae]|uniref:Phosphoglycerate mutase n=1 Tax=Symbiobacterium terraclitae TaxID=557451 RepID=A0ABS4JT22_9FIRM|nr:putative phosphoglycerate mutase [Symbiobacterium terraclitae]